MPAFRALWGLRKVYPEGDVVRRVDPDRTAERASRATVRFYRRFTPAVLAEVVSAGEVLPAGVTRLGEFMRHSWQSGRVRYYAEPVILFE